MDNKPITSKLCLVKNTGLNGNLFGGEMLAWMDETAAIFAHKELEKTLREKYSPLILMSQKDEIRLVTLRFGEIFFKKPVKVGDIVDFYCFNKQYGLTSLSFNIEGKIKDESVFLTDCTFVRVDKDGNKCNIFKV